MADIITPDARSLNMSKIRSKDTKIEEYIRKRLYSKGFRYKKNYKNVLGCPDVWLSKYNLAIFVHGCFWHRHNNCKLAYTPKSKVDFWEKKFQNNINRDKVVQDKLKNSGVRILIIWECTIKKMMKSSEAEEYFLKQIESFIISGINEYEI